MKKLNEKEMKQIKAGGVSGAWLTALWKGLNIFIDAGRYVGSSIRRLTSKNLCDL